MNTKIKNSLVVMLITILVSAVSCEKVESHQSIPTVPVDLYLDINSTFYIELSTVGGWLYLTGGYKGILVYRLSPDEFVAYDRACPYDPSITNSIIELDNSNLICQDTVCGSKFLIIDGSVHEGPATLPMKYYRTSFDGSVLRIYN